MLQISGRIGLKAGEPPVQYHQRKIHAIVEFYKLQYKKKALRGIITGRALIMELAENP